MITIKKQQSLIIVALFFCISVLTSPSQAMQAEKSAPKNINLAALENLIQVPRRFSQEHWKLFLPFLIDFKAEHSNPMKKIIDILSSYQYLYIDIPLHMEHIVALFSTLIVKRHLLDDADIVMSKAQEFAEICCLIGSLFPAGKAKEKQNYQSVIGLGTALYDSLAIAGHIFDAEATRLFSLAKGPGIGRAEAEEIIAKKNYQNWRPELASSPSNLAAAVLS